MSSFISAQQPARKLLFLSGLCLVCSLLMGCTMSKNQSNIPVTDVKNSPTTTSSPSTQNGKLTAETARQIATTSNCTKLGEISQDSFYNPSSKTWWFDITQTDKPDCKPACVVSEENETAEVNWRCSGGITPK